MNRTTLLLTSMTALTWACGPAGAPQPGAPDAPPVISTPELDRRVALEPRVTKISKTGESPRFDGPGPLFSNAGAFNVSTTSPGSATFTAAPVVDFQNNIPPTLGSGAWTSITVGGNTYATTTADAFAGVMQDDQGVDYLVVSAFTEELDPITQVTIGTVMHVLVLASDFSAGGTVALDGVDRLAIFARGDISLPDPQIAAAAVTGTVTFSAGGLLVGDLITASVTGDFGEIQWTSQPPPPSGTGTLTAGSYTLTVDPTPNVWCDGTLAGQEASFAGITAASVGLVSGPVTLTAGAGNTFDITGAPITSGFGVTTLTLDPLPDAPVGVVGGFVNGSGGGPVGTTFAGTYLMFDGTTASPTQAAGYAGAGYLTPAQDGFCGVDFLVDLGP